MNDPLSTGPVGPVFEPTPTIDMWQSGESQTPLPAGLVRDLQPPIREGDVGTYHGWPIVRLLGRGGMAVVLHGYDQKLRRDVAIKMIHPDRLDDPQMAARFAREARLTAQVNHPHVITVYSVHDDSECAFIVMEYLHGGTLQKYLREHPLSEEDCVRIARNIASGLQAAHEVGLLHRDLKPSNIGFRQPGGHVVIMDFGLARTLCDTDPLTIHGSPMGTPAYMSPEQIQVQKLDHRTDLFSLGTVMYRMLTAQHPFQGSTPVLLCHAIANLPHLPLRHYVPGVSPGLEAIIDRLLQKSPANRFQSAAQVIEALDRLSQQTPQRRRPWLIAGAVSVGLLAGAAAYQLAQLPEFPPEAVSASITPPVLVALPTTPDEPSSPAQDGSTSAKQTPPVPEFRDALGVVWRSTNRAHAGVVTADAEGIIRLEKSSEESDNWSMVEAELADRADARAYLLLDVVELSGGGEAYWAAKLAPTDGSDRDIELNYGHETGQFAFLLPDRKGLEDGAVIARIFIVGPDGAYVRFRNVCLADVIPLGVEELPVLSAN